MSTTPKRRHGRGEWITPMADMTRVSEAVAFVAFWPALALIGWIAINPAHFRSAVLAVLDRIVGVLA